MKDTTGTGDEDGSTEDVNAATLHMILQEIRGISRKLDQVTT